MTKKKDKKSYIFLDESGKPEIYSRKGINLVRAGTASKFLIIAAVKTVSHLAVQEAVIEESLKILRDKSLSLKFSPSYSLNAFHAQTDYLEVKNHFYKWIGETSLDFKITVIVVEKLKAYSQLQYDTTRLYSIAAGQLLKRYLHTAEDIEVIFSRRDSSLKTKERLQFIVDNLRFEYATKHDFNPETSIVYHHNPHYSHGGLQIADYIAHAVFQVFERKNKQWWNIIKNRVGYVQDIFNKKSYSRSNPL